MHPAQLIDRYISWTPNAPFVSKNRKISYLEDYVKLQTLEIFRKGYGLKRETMIGDDPWRSNIWLVDFFSADLAVSKTRVFMWLRGDRVYLCSFSGNWNRRCEEWNQFATKFDTERKRDGIFSRFTKFCHHRNWGWSERKWPILHRPGEILLLDW